MLQAKQIAASRALTEKVIRTLSVGKTPHALIFTKTGKGYVKDRGRRDLTAINANTFNVIKTNFAADIFLSVSPDLPTAVVSSIPVGKASIYFATKDGKDVGHATKGFRPLHEGLIHDEKK